MADARTCIDPNSSFSTVTKTFHSLRPLVPLPLLTQSLSVTSHVLSLLKTTLNTTLDTTLAFIDTKTNRTLTYRVMISQAKCLSASLIKIGLKKGDTAYVLVSTSLEVPILYLSLLRLGVVVSPGNPVSTGEEVARQVGLSKPVIGFMSEGVRGKVLGSRYGNVVVDSNEFRRMLVEDVEEEEGVGGEVKQKDTAAILYSSGLRLDRIHRSGYEDVRT